MIKMKQGALVGFIFLFIYILLQAVSISNVIENFFGNALSDIFVGIIVTILVTRFFENLTQKRNSIGALTLITAEIQIDKHILENMLTEMIPAFEKEMRRGQPDEIQVNQTIFEDAAGFMRISADALLLDAFHSTYVGIGNLENKAPLEKIINIYTVGYHYYIQTSFRMEQLNWKLLDDIKNRLKIEINNSEELIKDIEKEIQAIRNKNALNLLGKIV